MWKCSRCGTENDDSYDYCIVCGVEKNAPPVAQSQGTQTQQSSSQPPELPKQEAQVQQPPMPPEQTPQPQAQPQSQVPPPAPTKLLRMAVIQSPNSELIGKTIDFDLTLFSIISIGRNPENLLQFPDQSISRRHALIEFKDDKLFIKDLQSTNGTFIFKNGYFEKLETEAEINPGDVIKFGEGTVVRIIG